MRLLSAVLYHRSAVETRNSLAVFLHQSDPSECTNCAGGCTSGTNTPGGTRKHPTGYVKLREKYYFLLTLNSTWVDNIRMDLGEVGWGDVDWIGLDKDRNRWRAVVNSVLNLQVP
jgi:hypothetical protein